MFPNTLKRHRHWRWRLPDPTYPVLMKLVIRNSMRLTAAKENHMSNKVDRNTLKAVTVFSDISNVMYRVRYGSDVGGVGFEGNARLERETFYGFINPYFDAPTHDNESSRVWISEHSEFLDSCVMNGVTKHVAGTFEGTVRVLGGKSFDDLWRKGYRLSPMAAAEHALTVTSRHVSEAEDLRRGLLSKKRSVDALHATLNPDHEDYDPTEAGHKVVDPKL
jgi:hypothetical protein